MRKLIVSMISGLMILTACNMGSSPKTLDKVSTQEILSKLNEEDSKLFTGATDEEYKELKDKLEVFWNTPEDLKNGISKGVSITGNFVDLKLREGGYLYASYYNLETTKGISREVADIVNKKNQIQVSDTNGNTYEFVETTSVGRDIWKKVDKLAPYPDFDFNYIFEKYKTKSNALVTHKYSKKLLLLITQEEVDKLLKPYGLGPMEKELKAESQRVNDFRYASVEVDRVKDTELDMTIEIQTTVNKYTINVSYNKNFGENLVIDRLEDVKRGQ